MIDIPFPDGAFIPMELPELDDAAILGGESPTPGGTVIFGGADLITAMSADGWLYVPYCGERAGRKFGTHCFKVGPQGQLAWVELPVFTEGRAGATIEPNGLFLHWPNARGNQAIRVQVPGFVTPGYPTSGQPAPAPPPEPTPSPTPPPSGEVVDEGARAYTSQVKRELKGELAVLAGRVGTLEQRPAGGGGLTATQVADVVWVKTPDAIYARLVGNDPGLTGEIRRIAGGATAPPIDRAALKTLILEVLKEVFAEAEP